MRARTRLARPSMYMVPMTLVLMVLIGLYCTGGRGVRNLGPCAVETEGLIVLIGLCSVGGRCEWNSGMSRAGNSGMSRAVGLRGLIALIELYCSRAGPAARSPSGS
jgi:hypothetical protein